MMKRDIIVKVKANVLGITKISVILAWKYRVRNGQNGNISRVTMGRNWIK